MHWAERSEGSIGAFSLWLLTKEAASAGLELGCSIPSPSAFPGPQPPLQRNLSPPKISTSESTAWAGLSSAFPPSVLETSGTKELSVPGLQGRDYPHQQGPLHCCSLMSIRARRDLRPFG